MDRHKSNWLSWCCINVLVILLVGALLHHTTQETLPAMSEVMSRLRMVGEQRNLTPENVVACLGEPHEIKKGKGLWMVAWTASTQSTWELAEVSNYIMFPEHISDADKAQGKYGVYFFHQVRLTGGWNWMWHHLCETLQLPKTYFSAEPLCKGFGIVLDFPLHQKDTAKPSN